MFFVQDFKLHMLRWHLLPSLGRLLADLAQLLGQHDYLDHYMRDLGPSVLTGKGPPSLPWATPGICHS